MIAVLFGLLSHLGWSQESLVETIEETRSSISTTEKKQREAMSHLFTINQRIKEISKRRASVNRKVSAKEAEVKSLAQDLHQLEGKSHERREALSHRIRQIYQAGRRPSMQWLFESQTAAELDRRTRFLKRMADSDHRYIQQFIVHLEQKKRKKANLTDSVRQLIGLQKQVLTQEKALSKELGAKAKLLAVLKRAKAEQMSQLKNLRNKVGTAEVEYSFFERKGWLRPPIEAATARTYGPLVDPKFRFKLMQKGNFYATRERLDVRAVFDGEVVLAANIPGFGRTVILDHGDSYYSIYAFTAKILVQEGQVVEEGAAIAQSGESSPLFGPGIYFEIRHFTDAIDPRPWIKESVIKTAQSTREEAR
ncbi:MAG: murein hydrolase activator EnvC [Bdellovibrionales bacterium]